MEPPSSLFRLPDIGRYWFETVSLNGSLGIRGCLNLCVYLTGKLSERTQRFRLVSVQPRHEDEVRVQECSRQRRIAKFGHESALSRSPRCVHTLTTMSSVLTRSVATFRPRSAQVSQRWISTTRAVREEVTSPNLGTVPPPKKPVGAFRGG